MIFFNNRCTHYFSKFALDFMDFAQKFTRYFDFVFHLILAHFDTVWFTS